MKKSEIEKEEKIVNGIIPTLNIINQTKKSESTTRIYEEYEGIKTIFSELLQELSNKDVYLGMGIRSSKDPLYNRLFTHWHKQRATKGVKARLIFSETEKSKYYKDLEKTPYTEIKTITGITPAAVAIAKNKTLIINFKDKPIGIVIEDKCIADSFRQFFESIWTISI